MLVNTVAAQELVDQELQEAQRVQEALKLKQQQLQQQLIQEQQFQIQLQQQAMGPAIRPQATLPTPEELRDVQIDPHLLDVVQQLDDDSFAVREEATKRLKEAAEDKLQLYAVLCTGGDLSAEQRYRVLDALRESLVETPRGALGIQSNQFQIGPMGPGNAPGPIGVRVDDLIPGLPAERVLKIGDRITHLDGEPLVQMNELQFRVQSRKPGEKIILTVQRTKRDDNAKIQVDHNNQPILETVEVEMELGSADLLNANNRQPRNVQLSVVEASRLLEASEAFKYYAPQPIELPVRGGANALLAMTARPSSKPGMEEIDPEIDRHPAVRDLLRDRQRIAEGTMAASPALREQWQMKLWDLVQLSQRPGQSSDRAAFLQAVIQRYAQLMNEELSKAP